MKVILCICLVVPLVLGNIIPDELDVDIEVYDYINDYLKAPTDEQKTCVQDAVKKIKGENPDLEWWFADLEKLAESVKAQYEKCKSIDKEPQQKKCLLKLKLFTKHQMLKLVKSLPKDKKQVLVKLADEMKKCFESASI